MRPLTLTLIAAIALTGCPKDTEVETPAAEAVDPARTFPEPLEGKTFEVPKPSSLQLANGMPVYVVENHEVPLFDVQMVFDVGSFADPEGKEGLAEATFDLLDEGAGDMDAAALSKKLRQIGGFVGSSASLDGASVGAAGLSKNLEQILDIWTTVLLEPTFPEEDWKVLQKKMVADLEAQDADPNSVALRLHYRVAYGDDYRGRAADAESVGSLTPADMKAFYEKYVGPGNARILVGGDVDPEAVVKALDARLGQWNVAVETTRPEPKSTPFEAATVYFVDEPGASQSVVRTLVPIGTRLDEDYFDLDIANRAFGGAFVARVNMLLREEKGWTYGARTFTYYPHGNGFWGMSTSVRTDATAGTLTEVSRLITEALGDKPLTDDEVAYMKSSVRNGYPAGFETTGALLAEQVEVQRYGLPADWTAKYLAGIDAVTTESANTALKKAIDPNRLAWFVVGDRAAVMDEVLSVGLPVVVLDREGNELERLEPTTPAPAEEAEPAGDDTTPEEK
ncbi:MAG: insulinase family protein [Deltaproteobacteria bacterium]|nr:MAG: insulinase family protein [Deltaproteobacteria bacterium]